MTDKAALRDVYRRIRSSEKDREQLSECIAQRLFNSPEYATCDMVYAFSSIGSEVETKTIIERALQDNKNVTLPKCLDKKGSMEFYYIDSLSELEAGFYGILEPKNKKAAHDSRSSICLVPGLAFDNTGSRLGYGAGYYDRFLEHFNGISIGLCFDCCMADALPTELTDKRVDIIITENQYIKIKEE